jgi:hypothetical protein
MKPRRYFIIPDTQVKPGVSTNHIDWAARAIVEYQPDVIVHLGDHWDMPSLSQHEKPGSIQTEGARVLADIEAGNTAFARLIAPMEKEQNRRGRGHRKRWKPEKHFLFGNHEGRITRTVSNDPKLQGVLTLNALETPGFQRHDFLKIVELDGIWFSHYFSNTLSGKPIGGSIDNRLNKIGRSFVQGHQQGRLYGTRQFPGSMARHGLVCGSFYLHDEHYRDAQSNGEWRGVVVLNEVENGDYDIMPLSMNYLRRRFS